MDSGLIFEQFDGTARGIRGAVEVFPQADLVVGVHGAGLANTIFCEPGGEAGVDVTNTKNMTNTTKSATSHLTHARASTPAAVLEMSLPEPEFTEFSHLAEAMGLRYFQVALPSSLFESRVWVDVPAVISVARGALGVA